jgi:hypothetical protein
LLGSNQWSRWLFSAKQACLFLNLGRPAGQVAQIDPEAARAVNPARERGFSDDQLYSRFEQANLPPAPCSTGFTPGRPNQSKGNANVCVPLGKKPPRVRTPQELCEERGIGPCVPPPPEAVVTAAP